MYGMVVMTCAVVSVGKERTAKAVMVFSVLPLICAGMKARMKLGTLISISVRALPGGDTDIHTRRCRMSQELASVICQYMFSAMSFLHTHQSSILGRTGIATRRPGA